MTALSSVPRRSKSDVSNPYLAAIGATATTSTSAVSSAFKKDRLVRSVDGSLTQELMDDDSTDEIHQAATAHAIRQAYSLVESKFVNNRALADKKLTEIEEQLVNMRKQHEYREKERDAQRNKRGALRGNSRRL